MNPSSAAAAEWLVKTADVNVRVMELGAGASTPWHFHSVVTDDVFCLEGEVEVRLRTPETRAIRLAPGQRQRIPPRCPHSVANVSAGTARYLLVQGTGPRDFIALAD